MIKGIIAAAQKRLNRENPGFYLQPKRRGTCRRRALECEKAATLARDIPGHLIYLELARQWRDMAEHVEALERFHSALQSNFSGPMDQHNRSTKH